MSLCKISEPRHGAIFYPRAIIWTTLVELTRWSYIPNIKDVGLLVSDKKNFKFSVKTSIVSSCDLDVQWTRTILTTLKEGLPKIISVKFGQNPKIGLGGVSFEEIVYGRTDGRTHARTQTWTNVGRRTKCDHKSSPCHYLTGELKRDIFNVSSNTLFWILLL